MSLHWHFENHIQEKEMINVENRKDLDESMKTINLLIGTLYGQIEGQIDRGHLSPDTTLKAYAQKICLIQERINSLVVDLLKE